MSDDTFQDPDEETNSRWQGEKETLGTSSSSDPPPWKVGDQLNDFILEKLLGSGSSGVVYRALDAKTSRRCALKLLKHGTPDDLLRNKLGFRRMMSIEHPNLLRVDRIYQLGSYIALSMEEVDGLTFSNAVTEYQDLEPGLAYEKLLNLMRDFASGLAMMHANGYIHRDIKPENLMVDHHGIGRVIDYGLVDSFELDETSFSVRGFLLGTPRYFAPEVIWGQRYLPAGDMFGLGIVMLDALRRIQQSSGQEHPGLERSDTSRLDDAERIDEAIQDLSESVPSVIRNACREMLDRDPAERPTARELVRLGLPPAQASPWPHEQPLIGRDWERDEICSWLDEVFGGNVGRLHLTGPSGIGKSRLIEEIVKYIESKNWGQVFNARCRLREDQPLQAFDQICDAITNRYMKGDREPLELDPISGAILQEIFPVLTNIVKCSMQLVSVGTTNERLDPLEAAARMSEQLRLVGPLFLIIDDAQWADRDSLNTLDRLQSAVGDEGLGIITVSRECDDPQRVRANKHLALQPLSLDASVDVLDRSAQRWSVGISDSMLQKLAEATGGSPFRLRELADEFRPGGALTEIDPTNDSTLAELGQVDRLWQKRTERLSDDAKLVLPYVVTAGGRVSTNQLGKLTGLGDSVDAAISELARQRLITDEATGGECIVIFHDRVADELVKTLSEKAKRKAHHAWASLLVRQDNPESLAARISGHFFAADEPGRAVAHAILAAENAERIFARCEAARWYARVIPYVEGKEKILQLRNAARCFDEADFPVEAAASYQQLAKLVDDEERIEYQLLATASFIRSGRFSLVRDQLQELTQTLRLPKPKSALQSQLALLASGLRLSLYGPGALVSRIEKNDAPGEVANSEANEFRRDQPIMDRRQQQRLRLCLSLVRPMSMFDNMYAAELSVTGCMLSLKYGNDAQMVNSAVGEALFGCYDNGYKRIKGEAKLLTLKPCVARLNSSRATADLWAGIAYSHALACRWDHVSQPLQTSIENYEAVTDSHGFELAHTRWLGLWANWNLGRWDAMQHISDVMFDDATKRSDLFQQMLTTGGFGGAAWLARDKTSELRRIRASNAMPECNPNQTQMFHVFDWISSIQDLLYEGKFCEAWSEYQRMEPSLQRMPYSKMQLFRVSRQTLGTLVALHNLTLDCSDTWIFRIQTLTHQMRGEQISHARILANLYEGILQHQIGKFRQSPLALDAAKPLLQMAQDEARDRRLRPYQLAAEDALAEIQTGKSLERLRDRMRNQNVVCPTRLQRLYTVAAQ